jgi:ribose transport system ATP-binding protein
MKGLGSGALSRRFSNRFHRHDCPRLVQHPNIRRAFLGRGANSMSAETSSSIGTPLLRLQGIRKSFGGVEVLKGVDFDVLPGEVHALCGENGAGKSTLMNIMAGVHQPDAGTLTVGGETRPPFASAHEAQRSGVGIVFQERSLFGPLTAAENIFAGRQPITAWGMIDRRRLRDEAHRLLAEVAPDVAPETAVIDLSPAQQQMVEIAKALSLDARILIFDEPTAALTQAETDRLFAVIRRLQARGVGIVYISHRLEEIFALSQRVTVLKDGTWQGTIPTAGTTPDELIRRMVGRDMETPDAHASHGSGPVLLEVQHLADGPEHAGAAISLKDVGFHVRAGEIVALAGLAGAGRTETALALFGARTGMTGEIRIEGKSVRIHSPADAIAAGLGYVSEDRKELGLFLEMSIHRNVATAWLKRFGGWWYRDHEERSVADDFRSRLRVVSRDVAQDVGHLSGGNQQKVLLARWLLVNPKVLIVDEPTRGIDVGAKAEVHALLRDFAGQGHAVVMISSDLPEVLTVSDRVYVLRAGRVAGELSRAQLSEEAVMRLAAASIEPSRK